MHGKSVLLGFCLVTFAASALAQTNPLTQTNVTNNGNGVTYEFPYYTGTAALSATSPISVSGSNVGIGAASPATRLVVSQTYATANPAIANTSALTLANPSGAVGSGGEILFSSYTGTYNVAAGIGFYTKNSSASGTSGDLVFATKPTVSASSLSEDMRIQGSTGYVGIGTPDPGAALEVYGNIKLSANSGGSIIFPDGSIQSVAANGVCGGDYAESVDVTGDRTAYGPGDVLVLDPANPGRFLKSAEPYSTLVSGIYSTKPGMVGRRQLTPKSAAEVPMAIIGIVPAKVSAENGPINVGDLLVSSSTPGYAMRGTDRSRMQGAVIGKAMGVLDSGKGVIEVLVTLQ